jgi:predicted AAA+ superfamily ATPase
MIIRYIAKQIAARCNNEKIILLFGARQVGKSTLLKEITRTIPGTTWMNADDPVVQSLFQHFTVAGFKAFIGNAGLIVIDEAQQIEDIGKKLKLLFDNQTGVQLIATGSSAFELRNKMNEPLTGRKWEYHLYPFSFSELANHTSILEEVQQLPLRLLYGCYPDVVMHPGEEKERLQLLTDSYLYKDILMWQGLKKPEKIIHLLKALALQTGNEVNYSELGNLLKLDKETVEKYINVLEQTFVIFRLPSYSTNHRKELAKGKKIYFFDTGIRNALIGDYRPLEIRQDKGALWENYIISELWKMNQYKQGYGRFYFWRTNDQQEIDLIIDKDGTLHSYEIKWSPNAKARLSKTFSRQYPNHSFSVIHPENYWQWLMEQ